ncbi:MAG: 1-acyl-sn-glycerol-3-phosphate acyltransferase [Myxococcota bacterium]
MNRIEPLPHPESSKVAPPVPDAQDAETREKVLATSAMPTRFGGVLRTVFAWIFGTIEYPPGKAETVRELAAGGTVVYIARAPSMGLALYFNHVITRTGLPLPRFLGGANLWLWQPLVRYWRSGFGRRTEAHAAWRTRFGKSTNREASLANTLLRGSPAFLFLPRQRSRTQRRERTRYDFIRAMVAAQHLSDTPIYLVPHAVTDQVVAGASGTRSLGARLFGDRRRQGRFRQLAMLISPTRRASVRVADAIDLKAYLEESGDLDDESVSRRLRHELHRRISDEERVIAGPELPPPETLTRHVLRAPQLRKAIEAAKADGKGSDAQLERKAASDLNHIAARYNVTLVRILDRLLHWVFNRIYDGIVVDESGLSRTIELSRRAPIVLCPSHRSHVDYLVMSYVLFRHGITPPHIAAGANLAFFPLGYLFRRAGAFFLRRTFGEDRLYASVFRGYVGELLRHGTSIEFFPEGTRSRTGKTLLPRFGMFSMIVGAWREDAQNDIQFIPVSIDYDRIIEAGAYQKELKGAEKKSEDVRGLLKTTKVLRSRYGRVHLQFGQPVALKSLAEEFSLPQTDAPEHDDTARALVGRLGYRINHDIARLCTVTPTAVVATALLSHRGRGLAQRRLLRLAQGIIEFLDDNAARLSESLLNRDQREAPLLEAIEGLVREGTIVAEHAGEEDAEAIYRVPEERRVILDYHKNALMNHFAPVAMVAVSMRRHGFKDVEQSAISEDVKFLSRLFKREFLFRADSGFDVHLEDSVASLVLLGLVDFNEEDTTVSVRDHESMEILSGLIDTFLEAYWVSTLAAESLAETALLEKELRDRALQRLRRMFLEGAVSRPEAANQTVVAGAMSWLRAESYLEAMPEGRREVLRIADSARCAELHQRIRTFLKS